MSLNNFVRYTQDLEKWKRHFINPIKKYKGKYRIVQSIPNNDVVTPTQKTQPAYTINLVTPTQAAVEQAKSQLKAVEHLKTDKQPSKVSLKETAQTMKKRKR